MIWRNWKLHIAALALSVRPRKLVSKFITSEKEQNSGQEEWPCKAQITKVLRSFYCDLAIGFVVIIDFTTGAMLVDSRAAGIAPSGWVWVCGYLALMVYTIEYILAIFAWGLKSIKDQLMLLDFFILAVAYCEILLDVSGMSMDSFALLRLLRLVRILRLVKLFRKFKFLRELHKLIAMAMSCAKTLAWSFLFCFIIMTAWSMALVELVHPTVLHLHERGLLEDTFMTQTVMSANLYLFKTVIAGDSWGETAVPVIVESPWSAIIFIGSHLTLVFGVLNLVVAVVVDTFAEKRQRDIDHLAQELADNEEEDLVDLEHMFRRIDEDSSGELSLEEVLNGAKKVPEFQSRLRVMDIDKQDLEQLFNMLDEDGGGSIDAEEFISALSRWMHESKTASRFVKFNVEKLLQKQGQVLDQLHDLTTQMCGLARGGPTFQQTQEPVMSGGGSTSAIADSFATWRKPTMDVDSFPGMASTTDAGGDCFPALTSEFDQILCHAIKAMQDLAMKDEQMTLVNVKNGILESLRGLKHLEDKLQPSELTCTSPDPEGDREALHSCRNLRGAFMCPEPGGELLLPQEGKPLYFAPDPRPA
eukprot:TRINITY_DN23625_c0_g1_i2.p1 TRINITY_DN23625_c0_g1~~TRINITY_DN23625_c0_g1_i2.p1  ORF type:complete len:587 (-),score=73.00 TRINITY_DN23625_c0_g1_i2:192-1952(-)